jgi:hypothetical protein
MSNQIVRCVRRIRAGIDKWDVPAPRRRAAERDLLAMLETGVESERLGELKSEVHGLKGAISDLVVEIQNGYALPKAILATSRRGWTRAKAVEAFGSIARALDEAHALAAEVGVGLGASLDAGATPAWALDIEDDQEFVHVIIDQRALADLVLPAIEAFRVPRTKKIEFSEVGGMCFGHVLHDRQRVHGRGEATTSSIHVSWCVTQLRARMHENYVQPNPDSERAIVESAEIMMPHVRFLGGFHSHPWKRQRYERKSGIAQMREDSGWELSDGDRAYLRKEVASLDTIGKRPLVEIVIGIAEMERRRELEHDSNGAHTFQFVVGDMALVVAAYAIRRDGEARPVQRLTCWWRN